MYTFDDYMKSHPLTADELLWEPLANFTYEVESYLCKGAEGYGCNLKRLAKKAHISARKLQAFINLRRYPSYKEMVRLSEAMGSHFQMTPFAKFTWTVPLDRRDRLEAKAEEMGISVRELMGDSLKKTVDMLLEK